MLLPGQPHTQILGLTQVTAAAAPAPRMVRDSLVGIIAPPQVPTGIPAALARSAGTTSVLTPARLVLRRSLPRLVITRRRHRGVPAVPRQQPLQPSNPRGQLGDLPVLLGIRPACARASWTSSSRDRPSKPDTGDDHAKPSHHDHADTPRSGTDLNAYSSATINWAYPSGTSSHLP